MDNPALMTAVKQFLNNSDRVTDWKIEKTKQIQKVPHLKRAEFGWQRWSYLTVGITLK